MRTFAQFVVSMLLTFLAAWMVTRDAVDAGLVVVANLLLLVVLVVFGALVKWLFT